jgi:hypothetical protein
MIYVIAALHSFDQSCRGAVFPTFPLSSLLFFPLFPGTIYGTRSCSHQWTVIKRVLTIRA